MNVYDVSELNAPVAGRTLRAAAAAWAPWIITTRNLRDQEVWGGPSYDFFEETLQLFDPQPTIDIIPGWATQASRMMFPASSYTACVHDVAVGNFDICLADLWLTPERNQLVTFLPAVRSDYFYLVVPKNLEVKTDITFLSRLEKPFLPFTPGAWMAVVGFLCIMSTLLWLRQLCETGCHGDLKTNLRVNVVSFLRSLFFVWHDFLLGQSSMDVETWLLLGNLNEATKIKILYDLLYVHIMVIAINFLNCNPGEWPGAPDLQLGAGVLYPHHLGQLHSEPGVAATGPSLSTDLFPSWCLAGNERMDAYSSPYMISL